MKSKRPTINDVARRAGVSKATVSAVLNDRDTVRDSTRAEVLRVMAELNYRPSEVAKRIGGGRHGSIGLLIKEVANPHFSEMTAVARTLAGEHGYTLLIASSEGEYDAERQIVELFRAKDVDGLLISPVLDEYTDLTHLFEMKRRNFPFVLLEDIRGVQASVTDSDHVHGSRLAVDHLIREGHTRIVHFAGPGYSMHSEQRIAGVRQAFSESSLVFQEGSVLRAGAHPEDGYRVGLEYFRGLPEDERPTAVFCFNDLVAVGLLRALAELGIQVPGKVSVIGYDDIGFLGFMPLALTTVRVPRREMVEWATTLLIRHIESRKPIPPQKVLLEPELVIRGSTRSLQLSATASPPEA